MLKMSAARALWEAWNEISPKTILMVSKSTRELLSEPGGSRVNLVYIPRDDRQKI